MWFLPITSVDVVVCISVCYERSCDVRVCIGKSHDCIMCEDCEWGVCERERERERGCATCEEGVLSFADLSLHTQLPNTHNQDKKC